MKRSVGARVVVAGWAGLAAATTTWAVAALVATGLHRVYERCAEQIVWTFAPLLFSCGPPDLAELLVGWLGTLLVIGGYIAGVAASVVALVVSFNSRGTERQLPVAIHLAVATAATLVTIALVIASDPDSRTNAIGSWQVVTALSALLVCVITSALGPLITRRSSSNQQSRPEDGHHT